MTESDGIDDALEGVVHLTLTSAERLGSEVARARSELLHQARQRGQEPVQTRWDTPERRGKTTQANRLRGPEVQVSAPLER